MGKKSRIEIPKYTLGEELVSAISHGVGALLGAAALVLCLIKAINNADTLGIVCSAVYGFTLVVLYTMSTMYHSLAVNKAKKVFRVIDHCSIYLLIAGTYTPYSLITLNGVVGYIIFGIVWATAIVGITFSAIDLKKVLMALVGMKTLVKKMAPHSAHTAINSPLRVFLMIFSHGKSFFVSYMGASF